ncbi:MAG: hypothetical protein PWP19_1687, partial [Thermococcaceae archaeon]|nr:hypothetical protein [Thermococcaceae archaeon]
FRVFESVIPSGDHDNHLKEFSKNPNKGYYKHAPVPSDILLIIGGITREDNQPPNTVLGKKESCER